MPSSDDLGALVRIDPPSGIPERIVPGRTDRAATAEHMARYAFAAKRVRGAVLGLGAGVGYGAAIIAAGRTPGSGDPLVAVDRSTDALAFGRNVYGRPICFAAADAASLPLPDDSLDSVVCLEAIEHVPRADVTLGEIARVLRPDGLLVISTPNKWATSPLRRRPINPYHVREWYRRQFRRLISKHFVVQETYGQSWHSLGLILRVVRHSVRASLRAGLYRLHLMGVARRAVGMHRKKDVQEASGDDTAPSPADVSAAWPLPLTPRAGLRIPVTLVLIAKPLHNPS